MKLASYYKGGDKVQCYQPGDLDGNTAVELARDMWRKRCDEYLVRNGDAGSCVLGAGIVIHYLPKYKRNAQKAFLIGVHEVCCSQGSMVWESSVKDIIAFLKKNGIEASYSPGRMD